MSKISESDAVSVIKSGAPFNIQFVTADASRKSGGKRIVLENAVGARTSHSERYHGTVTIAHPQYDRSITIHRKLIEILDNKTVVK
jgi:hypothetical protein